jgi:hypothetical protein
MRDYHRRRQIQQDGKQSGDNSHLRSEVKGQTHKFRLGLAQNLREWVPAKAKDQKQKRPSTKKGTPKAKRLGVRATSGPRISQGSPVDDFGTVTSPGTELAYRDNFLQTETRLDPQFWVERSDSVFDVAVLEQWLASLSLTLQSAALYNSPSSGLLDPFSSMSLLITPRTQLLLDHYCESCQL